MGVRVIEEGRGHRVGEGRVLGGGHRWIFTWRRWEVQAGVPVSAHIAHSET